MKLSDFQNNRPFFSRKTIFLLLLLAFTIFIFLFPFFITTKEDSLLSIISFSFTGLGAFASLFTLVLAIILYQRFGLESKFVEKKADTVLALAECLKGKVIIANYEEGHFFIRPEVIQINKFVEDYPMFKKLLKKIVTVKSEDDYYESMKPILRFTIDPWLPEEIKEKLKLLDFSWYLEVNMEDSLDKYAEFDFGTDEKRLPILPGPEITVEQFIMRYSDLVLEINNWLRKHCDIVIDLKLKESWDCYDSKK